MKSKFPREQCLEVARTVILCMESSYERIEICGSVRRGNDLCSDVEILFIPKLVEEKSDMFSKLMVDQAAAAIEKMVTEKLIVKRHNIEGHISAWGPLNKLARHLPSGIPVDLFATTAENWAVSLVVRTGSKETNLRLTTGANKLNRTLHAYGGGITDRKTGTYLLATTEREVFELCGIQYLEPHER